MIAGHDEDVAFGKRIHVEKGQDGLILENHRGGNLHRDDLTEDAIRVAFHGKSPFSSCGGRSANRTRSVTSAQARLRPCSKRRFAEPRLRGSGFSEEKTARFLAGTARKKQLCKHVSNADSEDRPRTSPINPCPFSRERAG